MIRKWSYEVSKLLYKRIFTIFGPHKSWQSQYSPGNGQVKIMEDIYNTFCEDFAKMIGAKSGMAVKQQIALAIAKQEQVRGSQIETWYRNKMAALEAGFITKDYLPLVLLCEYEVDSSWYS